MNNKEIINKVANSGLINIDLSNYAPKEEILELDIKQFLFKGVILKKKSLDPSLKITILKNIKKSMLHFIAELIQLFQCGLIC